MDRFAGHPRFTIGPLLGSGGFGDVYLATDRELGAEVALKVLREPRGTSLLALKREFHNLAHVLHEHLVTLYGLHEHEGLWFVTMQLVRGKTLREMLPLQRAAYTLDLGTSDVPLDPAEHADGASAAELVDWLGQAAVGIQALHDAGLVHGDLKPTNLLVGDDGLLRIADFGLTAALGSQHSGHSSYGTPLYAAPERVQGSEPAQSSDWYSFGVMLFEAVTGRPPFMGSAVLEDKLSRDAPRASEDALVPPLLDDLIAALLARDPASRPAGPAVLEALGVSYQPSAMLRPVERPSELARIVDVGRQVLAEGKPRRVDVVGGSGLGKSPLLRSVAQALDWEGFTVLSTRCHAAVEVPHQALDGLVDQIALVVDDVDEDLSALASLFPVLGEHGDGEVFGSERARRAQAGAELAWLLGELGPTALIIDNAQWGDADSGILLARTLAEELPLLVVLGRRPGQHSATAEALADGLPDLPCTEIELAPLTPSDLARHAPELDEPTLGRVLRESQGNAYLVSLQLSRSATGSVIEILDDTVRALGPAALDPLCAVCTSPAPLTRARLVSLMGGSLEPEAMLELRHRALVHVLHDGRLEPYHARVREVVLASLGEEGNRRWSERHVALLLGEERVDHAALLNHLEQLGDYEALASHAAVAAEEAVAQHAPLQAARLWRWVLDHGQLEDEERLELLVRQGEAFSVAGRAQDAADAYLAAAELSPEPGRLRTRAAAALLNTGDAARGIPLLRELLSEVGVSWPSGALASVARILAAKAKISWLRGRFVEGPTEAGDRLRLDVLHAAATGLGLIDPVRGATLQNEHTVFALRAGDRYRAARALFVDAAYSTVTGPSAYPQAVQRLDEAARFAAELPHDDYLDALSLMSRGLTAYLSARNEESAQLFGEAEAVYRARCRDVLAEVSTAASLRAFSLEQVDRWAELVPYIQPRLQEALHDDNIQLIAMLGALQASRTHLLADRVDAAWALLQRTETRLSGVDAVVLEERLIDARCDLLRYEGRFEEAFACWSESHERMRRAGLLRLYIRGVRSHARLGMLAAAAGELGVARQALARTRKRGGHLAEAASDVLAARIALASPRPDAGALQRGVVGARMLKRPLLEAVVRARIEGQESGGPDGDAAAERLRAQGAVRVEPWFDVLF